MKIPDITSDPAHSAMDGNFGNIAGCIAVINNSGTAPRLAIRSANGNWYEIDSDRQV